MVRLRPGRRGLFLSRASATVQPMPSYDPARLDPELAVFFQERHLATLTVLRADGSPQVTPVGFTYEPDERLARVITWEASWKARHVGAKPGVDAAICTVDGGRWATLYGSATVARDAAAIAEGVRRYAERYRSPSDRPDRVVIEVEVSRIVGRLP